LDHPDAVGRIAKVLAVLARRAVGGPSAVSSRISYNYINEVINLKFIFNVKQTNLLSGPGIWEWDLGMGSAGGARTRHVRFARLEGSRSLSK